MGAAAGYAFLYGVVTGTLPFYLLEAYEEGGAFISLATIAGFLAT
jgi:hypothetical protein